MCVQWVSIWAHDYYRRWLQSHRAGRHVEGPSVSASREELEFIMKVCMYSQSSTTCNGSSHGEMRTRNLGAYLRSQTWPEAEPELAHFSPGLCHWHLLLLSGLKPWTGGSTEVRRGNTLSHAHKVDKVWGHSGGHSSLSLNADALFLRHRACAWEWHSHILIPQLGVGAGSGKVWFDLMRWEMNMKAVSLLEATVHSCYNTGKIQQQPGRMSDTC